MLLREPLFIYMMEQSAKRKASFFSPAAPFGYKKK